MQRVAHSLQPPCSCRLPLRPTPQVDLALFHSAGASVAHQRTHLPPQNTLLSRVFHVAHYRTEGRMGHMA